MGFVWKHCYPPLLREWSLLGSNQGPIAYEATALTDWAKAPKTLQCGGLKYNRVFCLTEGGKAR